MAWDIKELILNPCLVKWAAIFSFTGSIPFYYFALFIDFPLDRGNDHPS